MLDLPESELFSAYIDGELTADQQAEVEQTLAKNPEAQRLVDELRSLSTSLRALPPYKLNEDLAARVMRQAEQEMLTEPTAPLPAFHQVDSVEPTSTSWTKRVLQPRNFAWSAVAVAVALILTVYQSGDSGGDTSGSVARNPSGVIIEPLKVGTVVEAVEDPKQTIEPTVVAADDPEPATPNGANDTAPEPAIMATADYPKPGPAEAATPLVLECRLADEGIGPETLAELLKQAGVELGEQNADGPVTLTLTTAQIRRVIDRLASKDSQFADYRFLSTAQRAGPRIPSAAGPGKSTPHEGHDAEKSRPKPAVKRPKDLPIKDNHTYRVEFVLKPAKTTGK